ncbi:response regulator transcription factor [Bradyrhizobium sp. B120]|uniref:response regulator transcription factor n=1 Tax=Bradyrhizobium sp. B120 TaxID=3410088 RepID=UPI003B9865D2
MNAGPNQAITPTPREYELMTLIARGMQNKNIARELKISENTVRAHIGNIMRKYRLQNRTQIAMFYLLQTASPLLRSGLVNASGQILDPTHAPMDFIGLHTALK